MACLDQADERCVTVGHVAARKHDVGVELVHLGVSQSRGVGVRGAPEHEITGVLRLAHEVAQDPSYEQPTALDESVGSLLVARCSWVVFMVASWETWSKA